MKKQLILFGVLTLMGTGAAFAFSDGTKKAGTKAFDEGCPPECCTMTTGKPASNACCYDPSCCD